MRKSVGDAFVKKRQILLLAEIVRVGKGELICRLPAEKNIDGCLVAATQRNLDFLKKKFQK